jgi:hypothetical protein
MTDKEWTICGPTVCLSIHTDLHIVGCIYSSYRSLCDQHANIPLTFAYWHWAMLVMYDVKISLRVL